MINRKHTLLDRSLLRCLPLLLFTLLFTGFLSLLAPDLSADDVYLKNGKKMVGIAKKDGDKYRVEFPTAVMIVPATKVEKVVHKPVPWEIYKKKLKKLKKKDSVTAGDHYKLALWAKKHDLEVHSVQQLQQTIQKNPNHKKARKKLGFVEFQGEWMSPEEMMRRRGFRMYNDKWLPKETAEKLVQKERARERKKRIKRILGSYVRDMARSPSKSRREQIYRDMLEFGKNNGLNIENKAAAVKSYYNKVWKTILVKQQAYSTQNLNVAQATVGQTRTVEVSNLGFVVQLPQVSLNKYSGGVKVPAN